MFTCFTHFVCGTRGRVSSSDVSRARTSRKNSCKIKLLIDICLPIEILELIHLFEYLLSRLNFVLIKILSKNYVKILKIELPNKNSFY